MRVVITDSTSMIGTALIEECVKREDEVLAVIRSSTKRMNRLSTSPLVKVEYADLEELSSIIGDGKPYDVFYHLAWGSTSKDKRDNPVIQERNIKATLEAVNVAHQLGGGVKNLLVQVHRQNADMLKQELMKIQSVILKVLMECPNYEL